MRRNGDRVCRMIGLTAAAAVLLFATGSRTALAQDAIYALGYYANAHTTGAPDATLRLVNDGNVTDSSPVGDLCASTYVFDNAEELIECCSCYVTPNGLLTLSVNTNLTSNTLTKVTPTRGVIKVVSSRPNEPAGCDPTIVNPQQGIRGWLTRVQLNPQPLPPAKFTITEEELLDSFFGCPHRANCPDLITSSELTDLAEDCKVAIELGSGRGVCSCNDAGR